MKERSSKPVAHRRQENPRIGTLKRLLSMAQLIRQRGEPDEAAEALEWEKKLSERLSQVESEALAA